MKNLTKIASLILALFFILCFASCKNEPSNEASGKAVAASFNGIVAGESLTVTFYEDKTLAYGYPGASVGGTYTGDVSKDGMGTITLDAVDGDVIEYDWKLEGDTITIGKSYFPEKVTGFCLTRI